MNPIQRLGYAVKAFALSFAGSRSGWFGHLLGGTNYDYRASAGDGRGNAIVMACTRWVCRTFPEAPLQIAKRKKDGSLEPIHDHPMVLLIERPNPFYSGVLLWFATIADWLLTGNAYWVKVRARADNPVQLWWVPSWLIEPAWPEDGSVFISHYEYRLNNKTFDLPVRDVVHFRDGFDPNNIRKGLSQLASLWREIATDNEAANYTAAVLRNMGVPGVVVSPVGDVGIGPEEAEEVKDKFDDRFGGDRRGSTLVMEGPTKVDILSFSPEQMQLREQRRFPEERVSAIFGTPAVVVGLGAGLDRATYANMAEAREAAYESMIIPTQRLFAADLQAQLLPDFADATGQRVQFDYSHVRVLQEDMNALHTRAREDLKAGLITLNQAAEMIGLDQITDGDIYYLPSGVTPKKPEDLLAVPEPPVAAPGTLLETDPAAEDEEEPKPPRRLRLAASLGGKDTTVLVPLTVADATEVERLFADRLQQLNGVNGAHP